MYNSHCSEFKDKPLDGGVLNAIFICFYQFIDILYIIYYRISPRVCLVNVGGKRNYNRVARINKSLSTPRNCDKIQQIFLLFFFFHFFFFLLVLVALTDLGCFHRVFNTIRIIDDRVGDGGGGDESGYIYIRTYVWRVTPWKTRSDVVDNFFLSFYIYNLRPKGTHTINTAVVQYA